MRGLFILPVCALIALLSGHGAPSATDFPFRDPDRPIAERVDDLIGRFTLEEKIFLMIERAAPVERLGIPAFPWWNEALHGVARAGRATVFPQAIGLAATWDADLMYRVASAIGDEARAMNNRAVARGQRNLYQGLTIWSPNINIFRDPRWGRGQETYGEDPVLTGQLGVAFVRGIQGDHPRYLKTIATPKHFAVHSGPEPDRHTFDARPSDYDLHDTYLPAFRATVVEGRAGSIMCAYNAFRGLPACGSVELLQTILRDRWRFDGYVVSDCSAVRDIWNQHKARDTPMDAAAMALLAGTDLECGSGSWSPGHPDLFLTLTEAVKAGLVKESDIDTALRRLVTAQMRLGVYDPPERVPFTRLTYDEVVDSPKHRALALDAARKSIVLLKNDNNTLPLPKTLTRIAVIGPNADDEEVLVGNYAGTPVQPVSILHGISTAAAPGTEILYARGGPLAEGLVELRPVPVDVLWTLAEGKRVNGLTGMYYGRGFEGAPVFTRVDPAIDFDWADRAPLETLDPDGFSIRWSGEIHAPATGSYTLGFRGATSYRLFIDNRLVAHGRGDHEPPTATAQVMLRAGRSYPIRIEYEHEKYDAVATLLWAPPSDASDTLQAQREQAVALARSADAVVLVLGLSSRLEGEEMSVRVEGFAGGDRTSLDLPAAQRALLEDVVNAVSGKPVVLVLMSGSALAVNWADQHVPAILQAWYPGQAGGTAVADVLFGNVSPAGRLPITFYRSVDQLPPFADYSMKNRTYRYFTGEPLYSFGHGLSYARFEYSKVKAPAKLAVGNPLTLSVDVRNAGRVTSDEVVQVYLSYERPADEGAPLPIRALKAFRRITLKPGERRTVTFTLTDRDLALVGADGAHIIVPGRVTLSVGGRQPDEHSARRATSGVVTATVELSGPTRRLAW